MNNLTSPKEYKLSKGYTNYIFILLFLLYFFDYVDRLVVTSLFPFIKADWGITDAQCGMLVSAVYWSIVIFTFPVSILVDRWSRKKSIGLMAIIWSLATAACALTRNFSQLRAARMLIGIGEAGYAPGGTAMIAGLYPEEKRSRMMGIWNMSIPLGSAVGIALGGIIATHWGWRHAFGLVALPGLIVAILFFFVKDYKTVELTKTVKETSAKVKMKTGEIAREFLHTPSLILTYFGFAAMVFVTSSLMTWLPSFLNRVYNIPVDQAGMKVGIIMMMAIVGAPLGGFLADMWTKKRKNARLLLSALSAILSAVIFYMAFVLFTGSTQYILLLAGGLTVMTFVPAAAAVTQDVVHPGLRAVSYAFCVIVQNLLGASVGPVFIGAMSDKYGIAAAVAMLPLFLVVAAGLFFIGSFFYKRDLAKVERITLEHED
jgi:predicted MFS family arabinose efflux permease